MFQASLRSLCDARALLNMYTFTNLYENFFVVFMLNLLFIHTLDYFLEIPHG